MKKLILAALVVGLFTINANFAQAGELDANPTSITLISQTMNSRLKEVFEKSGNPAIGEIDIIKFKTNVAASIADVAAMSPSSKQVVLEAANENLQVISEIIEAGQWGPEQIKGFYANLSAE